MKLKGIVLFGAKRSGKDTLAKYLCKKIQEKEKGVKLINFSDFISFPLKKALKVQEDSECLKRKIEPLHIPVGFLETLNTFLKEAGLSPLDVKERCALLSVHGFPFGKAYRFLLQYFSTEIVRKRAPHFWTNLVLAEVLSSKGICIVSGGRLLEEWESLSPFALTVGIKRSGYIINDRHRTEAEVSEVLKKCNIVVEIEEGFQNLEKVGKRILELFYEKEVAKKFNDDYYLKRMHRGRNGFDGGA